MFKIKHENFIYNKNIIFLNKLGVTLFEGDSLNTYRVVEFLKWGTIEAIFTIRKVLEKVDGNLNVDVILDEELSNLTVQPNNNRGNWEIESKDGIKKINIKSIFDNKKYCLKIEDIVIEEVKTVFRDVEHNLDRLILNAPSVDFRYNVYFKFKKIKNSNTIEPIPAVSFATKFPKFIFGEYLRKTGRFVKLPDNGQQKSKSTQENENFSSDASKSTEKYLVLLDEGVETAGLALLKIINEDLENSTVLEYGVFRENYASSFKRIMPNAITKDLNPKVPNDWQRVLNSEVAEQEIKKAINIFGNEIIALHPNSIFKSINEYNKNASVLFFSSNVSIILKNIEIIEAACDNNLNVFVHTFDGGNDVFDIGEHTKKIKTSYYNRINSFQRREILRDPSKNNLYNIIRPIL